MDAFDIMTTKVVTVRPDTSTQAIAVLLLENGISAVPVVGEDGEVAGMVSEGDLLHLGDASHEARRDWWLTLLAEGETLHPQFLAHLGERKQCARDIMSAPVITVTDHTGISEISNLLTTHRIKRVPVLRDGHIVGIVSRADLIRAIAAQAPAHPEHRSTLASWTARHPAEGAPKPAPAAPPANEAALTASDFRSLVETAAARKAAEHEAARRASAGGDDHKVQEAIEHHLTDSHWHGILDRARQAAAHGETEKLLLSFPAKLCSDGGRAINVPEPNWPTTLRGEAAETYLRFEHELKPQGFHLIARVLSFPAGFIGDIGLFLHWGGGSA